MSKYADRHNALLDTLDNAGAWIKQAQFDMGGVRINDSMLEALYNINQARTDIDAAERQAVEQIRSAGGTWQAIGDRLGMSRQAAQQRFSA